MEKKYEGVMSKISDKIIAIGISIGVAISLIPILVLAFYNYPCADDFSASDTAHWAWLETGSILEVIKAAIENVIFNYNEWSGVYVSVFWTSLQPGLFGEQFYGLTTVISIGLFVVAGIFLAYIVGKKYIKGSKYSLISICGLYLFTSLQCMPDGNEGLYWHAGGANYTWAFAFLLLLTACVLAIYKEQKLQKKLIIFAVSCIFAVLVGGGNYITALQGCMWLVLLNGVMFWTEWKSHKQSLSRILKENIFLVIPTIVMIVAFLVSVLAPGNKVRMGLVSGMNPITAIIESFRYVLVMSIRDWLKWPIWVLLGIAIPFMWNIVKQQKIKFSYPGMMIVLGYCITAAGFTPSLYAQGTIQAGRLRDTVFYILIFWIYVVTFYFVGWLYHKRFKTFKNGEGRIDNLTLTTKAKRCIIGLFFIWLVGSVFYVRRNTDLYVGTQALYSLINGQAQIYREENEKRLEVLKNEESSIILPKFTNPPSLLQFEDISPNPEEWLNTAMATYYGKESVQREE